jgi:hypothetical protein
VSADIDLPQAWFNYHCAGATIFVSPSGNGEEKDLLYWLIKAAFSLTFNDH